MNFLFFFGIIGAVALIWVHESNKNKENEKTYKLGILDDFMKIQNIFYTVGVLFILSAVIFFTREFIADLPDAIKTVLLVVAVIVSFIIAELLRGVDK